MGRIYLEHLGGSKLFSCAECDAFISSREELFSSQYLASTERAYSFNKVVNVTYSEKPTENTVQTSRNNILSLNNSRKSEKEFTRDVFCKVCTTKLGWIYEFISDNSKQFKEGKIVIEKRFSKEESGIKECKNQQNSKPSLVEVELETSLNYLSDSEVSEYSNSEEEGYDETG